jgi:transposase-like protein
MAHETSGRYLFVAIDRATRWVFIRIYNNKTAANARRFLRDLERACPMRIRTILTDNGKESTDRLFGLHLLNRTAFLKGSKSISRNLLLGANPLIKRLQTKPANHRSCR